MLFLLLAAPHALSFLHIPETGEAAPDACGLAAPPVLRSNQSVGLVRIQKTGSTALVALWKREFLRTRDRVWNEWSHDHHHDWHAVSTGSGFYNAAHREPPADLIVVNLRDPVERVLSEYYFCVTRRNCAQQIQWDYRLFRTWANKSASTDTGLRGLHERLEEHLAGKRRLSLREWLRWPGNPAHDRMSHYVSGLRYGEFWSGGALADALRNLCDARAVVLLSVDLPEESRALARYELGWQTTAEEWARHRERHWRWTEAPDHLPPAPARTAVSDEIRAEIRARNPNDVLLYDLARKIVLSRAAVVGPSSRRPSVNPPSGGRGRGG